MKLLLTGLAIASTALAAVLIAVPTPSRTIVMRAERTMDATQLKAEADLIIAGTFQTARTYTDKSTGEPIVLTEWTVQTNRALKGQASPTITVTLTGGLSGSVASINPDLPMIKRGQKAVMYLSAVPDKQTYIPISLRQGVFLEKLGRFTSSEGRVTSPDSL